MAQAGYEIILLRVMRESGLAFLGCFGVRDEVGEVRAVPFRNGFFPTFGAMMLEACFDLEPVCWVEVPRLRCWWFRLGFGARNSENGVAEIVGWPNFTPDPGCAGCAAVDRTLHFSIVVDEGTGASMDSALFCLGDFKAVNLLCFPKG